MRSGCGYRKEVKAIDEITARELRVKYPNHMPLAVAAQYLGLSPRLLSKLIAEGRKPFSSFGANIGIDIRAGLHRTFDRTGASFHDAIRRNVDLSGHPSDCL